jgi:hypothetical protein
VLHPISESNRLVVSELNNADEWRERETARHELCIMCSFYSLGSKNADIRENDSACDVDGILPNVGSVECLN